MTYHGQDSERLVIVDQRKGCLFWMLVIIAAPVVIFTGIFLLGLLATLVGS